MKIGIIIAVTRELSSLFKGEIKFDNFEVDHRLVFHSTYYNNDIYATQSGCGIIDAACATQFLITKYQVDLIINYGVTGALDNSLQISDLFVVTKTCNHDFDESAFSEVKKCQYTDYPDIYIPLTLKYIELAKKINPKIKEAVVASGNRFIEDKNYKIYLREELKCNICDMEIAAITRVANKNKVDVFSVKSISDTFDGNGKDFVENVVVSSQIAFNFIRIFLETICKK